jgi:hypothetical protein
VPDNGDAELSLPRLIAAHLGGTQTYGLLYCARPNVVNSLRIGMFSCKISCCSILGNSTFKCYFFLGGLPLTAYSREQAALLSAHFMEAMTFTGRRVRVYFAPPGGTEKPVMVSQTGKALWKRQAWGSPLG